MIHPRAFPLLSAGIISEAIAKIKGFRTPEKAPARNLTKKSWLKLSAKPVNREQNPNKNRELKSIFFLSKRVLIKLKNILVKPAVKV
tara:strand:- start:208 stop:468 length:261 start_codon:yes stop_codon:yes gene_type:complete